MTTLTPAQQAAITSTLAGAKHEACSIAAINLALSGHLTDDIPECMLPVISRWGMLRYLLRAGAAAGAAVLVEDCILLADGGHEDSPPTLPPIATTPPRI